MRAKASICQTLAALSALSMAGFPPLPARAAAPSFDCKKAEGQVQELVCGDAQLSALDRETMRLFMLAQDSKPKGGDRKTLAAGQRDWMKARDQCANATETRDCVLGVYLKRIRDLRGTYAAARSADRKGISLGPDTFDCKGFGAPITAIFVSTLTPLAYLTWKNNAVVAKLGPTGSGARYVAASDDGETVFWIKGREAMLTQPNGKTFQCRTTKPG